MTQLTTQEAAAQLHLSQAQVQRLCRAYVASGRGLACEKIGTGRHAIYLIDAASIATYKDQEHKPGWPAGKKRHQ